MPPHPIRQISGGESLLRIVNCTRDIRKVTGNAIGLRQVSENQNAGRGFHYRKKPTVNCWWTMTSTDTVYAGALLFSGSTILILAMMIAEAIYPGYSIAQNYISDLGVGSTAPIFNTAIILYGAGVIAAVYLLHRDCTIPSPALIVLGLSGAGAAGVWFFPETFPAPHYVASATAFLGGGVAVLLIARSLRGPFRYLSALLGCLALIALMFFALDQHAGIGPGGMERLVAYPLILCSAGFGCWLMAQAEGQE